MDTLHYEDQTVDTSDISNSLLKTIAKYKNHPTIKLIKNTFKNLSNLSFHYLDESDIEKDILNLNKCKASQNSDIPVKLLRLI